MFFIVRPTLTILVFTLLCMQYTTADVVSFLVDPTVIDNNPADGFIIGNEFTPVGTGGTTWTMEPTGNLIGSSRFQLSATTGLRFRGGGGSTLTFDFSPNEDVLLNSHTITENFAILVDPTFNSRGGATVISTVSTANSLVRSGYIGGPLAKTEF